MTLWSYKERQTRPVHKAEPISRPPGIRMPRQLLMISRKREYSVVARLSRILVLHVSDMDLFDEQVTRDMHA
eukprot:1355599-Amphidinium_carterae.1